TEGAATHLERAVQVDLDPVVRAGDLPGVGATEPVVWVLALPTVLDRLPEHPVLVAQAVAHGRELHRRHRVEEARRESPEAAVAEPGVGLLLEEADPVEVLLSDDPLRDRIEQQVHDVVRQRAADQELHRQVVDALRVPPFVGLPRAHPAQGQEVAQGGNEGLEARAGSRLGRRDDAVEEQIALVEPIAGPPELNGPAPVLLQKVRLVIGVRSRADGDLPRLSHLFAPRFRAPRLLVAIALHVAGLVPQANHRTGGLVLLPACAPAPPAEHEAPPVYAPLPPPP